MEQTYEVKFDANSPNWTANSDVNVMLFMATENHFNVLLNTRGYVFLRDIYESLGLPVTKDSCMVGWSKKMNSQSRIDFAIKPIKKSWRTCDFILGFDVDGNILNFVED